MRAMNIEERVGKVEKRVGRIEKRDDLIEQAILQMRDLLISHDNRLEDYYKALRESREEFIFKMNALVDAQVKGEDDMRRSREDFNFKMNAVVDAQVKGEADTRELRESIQELRKSVKELLEASRSQLTRIENLEKK